MASALYILFQLSNDFQMVALFSWNNNNKKILKWEKKTLALYFIFKTREKANNAYLELGGNYW